MTAANSKDPANQVFRVNILRLAFVLGLPRILPAVGLFRTEATLTASVAHLRQNLRDALVFLCFIPLAALTEYLRGAHALPSLLTLS